jgi:uncharacterized membrane protein
VVVLVLVELCDFKGEDFSSKLFRLMISSLGVVVLQVVFGVTISFYIFFFFFICFHCHFIFRNYPCMQQEGMSKDSCASDRVSEERKVQSRDRHTTPPKVLNIQNAPHPDR